MANYCFNAYMFKNIKMNAKLFLLKKKIISVESKSIASLGGTHPPFRRAHRGPAVRRFRVELRFRKRPDTHSPREVRDLPNPSRHRWKPGCPLVRGPPPSPHLVTASAQPELRKPATAWAPVRLCACAPVRLCACAPVRLCAFARVRLYLCTPALVRASVQVCAHE